MSKTILKRNTQIDEIKTKIYDLQSQCGELYVKCRNTGFFDFLNHDRLKKEIEWQEYLLWGARNGILR